MHLKNSSRWIVITGTLLIWTIKFIIRHYLSIPGFWKPLVGIGPNLIGSFILPFGACWFFQKYFRLQTLQDVKLTCWFGLLLVVIDEYIQLIPFFGRTFDFLDIIFSFIGVFMGYHVFAKLLIRSGLKETNQLV